MLDQLGRSVNLRDLGGISTTSGAVVRRGRVFRSAALSALAGEELAAVRALGIRTIIDLRHNDERDAYPTPWQALGCTDYWGRDHGGSQADLAARLGEMAQSAEDCRAAITYFYGMLPYEQAESYTRLFRAIASGAGPVLFHCAVGKDRTGVAAALILAAIGVPRAAILADYAATSSFDLLNSAQVGGHPMLTPDRAAIFAPLLAADPAYLEAMFAGLEARSGSIEAYLRDTLGLDEAERAALRTQLLEEKVFP